MRSTVLLLLAAVALTPTVARADHFVITFTHASKETAQRHAAETGGWVLDTNLYPKLKPKLFSVVRGPYASAREAKRALEQLPAGGMYREAYVKDAGKLQLSAALAGNTPSGVLAALLGELTVTLEERPGGEHPCEPEEPYLEATLSYVSVSRGGEDGRTLESVVKPLDIGQLAIIKRTGEVQRMRICLE